MIILTSLIVFIIIGLLLTYYDIGDISGPVITFLSSVFLFIAIISIPINRFGYWSSVEKINALQMTINESRKTNASDIERMAFLQKISDWNELIASAKFYNKSIFDIWIPDHVETLEFIK